MTPGTYRKSIVTITLLLLISVCLANAEKNSNIAMLLCVFPGGGQFYTERYVAGMVIGAAEIAIGYYAYKYHRDEEYTKRNSMLWWGLFTFGFSLADAYVGAKMHGFDVQTDIDKISVSYKFKF
ncbi:MAG: hypothetical protein JSV98_10375 [candidate division WOR-3 bacterium]|nr:MAG: hypothetical protein JSV98_10375 [candidate division WOR-3 bacterium]